MCQAGLLARFERAPNQKARFGAGEKFQDHHHGGCRHRPHPKHPGAPGMLCAFPRRVKDGRKGLEDGLEDRVFRHGGPFDPGPHPIPGDQAAWTQRGFSPSEQKPGGDEGTLTRSRFVRPGARVSVEVPSTGMCGGSWKSCRAPSLHDIKKTLIICTGGNPGIAMCFRTTWDRQRLHEPVPKP